MTRAGLFLWLGAFVAHPSLGAQAIDDLSYVDPEGRRVLALQTTVEAPVDEVWRLWTTEEGLGSWMVPVIRLDLSVGGDWEASYDPAGRIGDDGNILNEILAFIPQRMLALRVARVPPNYPFELEMVRQSHSAVLFEPLSEASTRITFFGMGYGEGPTWDSLYQVGLESTRFTLLQFRNRLSIGPVDWSVR